MCRPCVTKAVLTGKLQPMRNSGSYIDKFKTPTLMTFQAIPDALGIIIGKFNGVALKDKRTWSKPQHVGQ